jgi:hypothetical protein
MKKNPDAVSIFQKITEGNKYENGLITSMLFQR